MNCNSRVVREIAFTAAQQEFQKSPSFLPVQPVQPPKQVKSGYEIWRDKKLYKMKASINQNRTQLHQKTCFRTMIAFFKKSFKPNWNVNKIDN